MGPVSEDDLIARWFAPIAGPAALGLKDDAACLTPPAGQDLIITKDALVAGVHFFAEDAAASIARKALRVNVSDLAAKGAQPAGFLLALALPVETQASWLAEFARALGEDAKLWHIPLMGGDTVKTPGPLMVSITALGFVPQGQMVARTSVQPGDAIYVSGTIGDAALGLQLRLNPERFATLSDEARAHLAQRYLEPQPRLALASVLRAHASGGMDVSDGLVGDLTKMMTASGVSAQINLDLVPLSEAARAAIAADESLLETALTGGDDYELLVSIRPDQAGAFEAAAARAGIRVAQIGHALAGQGASQFTRSGHAISFERGSFSHF